MRGRPSLTQSAVRAEIAKMPAAGESAIVWVRAETGSATLTTL